MSEVEKAFPEQMREFFHPYAEQIVDSVSSNGLCIVTGRRGIGKTGFLYPEIKKLLGEGSVLFDIRNAADLGEIEEDLFKAKIREGAIEGGVLVIDEAQHFAQLSPTIRARLLEFSRTIYERVVLLLAYKAGNLEERDQWINNLQESGQRSPGREVPIHYLGDVTPELLEAYLKHLELRSDSSYEQSMVLMVKEIFPRNVKELDITLSDAYTLETARDRLVNAAPFWFWDSDVTPEEWQKLKDFLPRLSRAEEIDPY